MLIYSNTYNYNFQDYTPQTGSVNPQVYYENEDLHGEYSFIPLEELVNNFINIYLGDETILGSVPRKKVIYQTKQAIRQFTFSFLQQVKVVELELNDANNIILPPDYVEYVRVSWVDKVTGQLRSMSQNKHTTLGTAYLQDNLGDILFDNNGEILEGSTAIEVINDNLSIPPIENFENNPLNGYGCFGNYTRYQFDPIWNLDTTINFNGTFDINDKRIHFGADSLTRIILLEYVSDGLEKSESEMKVAKFAEEAVYAKVHYELASNSIRVPNYEKVNLKRKYDTLVRNAKVKMLKIKPQEFLLQWKQSKTWLR